MSKRAPRHTNIDSREQKLMTPPAHDPDPTQHAHAGPTVIQCGCAMPDDEEEGARKAVAVDPDAKARNTRRLRLIEGQVRGLQRMVEEDRYCADILMQISSVHEALRSVGRELMRNHIKHCATAAIKWGPDTAEPMYDELVDLMYKHSR